MAAINKPTDVDSQLADLQRQINDLRAGSISSQGGNVALPPGASLRVTASDGTTIGYLGAFTRTLPDGTKEQGLVINRHGGAPAITVGYDGNLVDPYRQTASLWSGDRAQVVGDDGASGSGLARPYIPLPLERANLVEMPGVTSASFLDTELSDFYKQHPKVLAYLNGGCEASDTTGEFRVLLDGVQVGSTVSVGWAVGVNVVGPFVVPGAHMSTHRIQVQARRVAGTGYVRVAASLLGVQS